MAAIYIKALDPSVLGNERYLFHMRELRQSDTVANIIRKTLPELMRQVHTGAQNPEPLLNMLQTNSLKFKNVFRTQRKPLPECEGGMVKDIVLADREGRGTFTRSRVVKCMICCHCHR